MYMTRTKHVYDLVYEGSVKFGTGRYIKFVFENASVNICK